MDKKESKKTAVEVVKKEKDIVIQKEKNPVLQMLQMAMTDSNVDLEKMEKIMQMVERHEDKQAFKAFNRDMATMQGEIPPIEFNSEIRVKGQLRSKFTTYEGIMKIVQPILSKNGFSVSFNPISKDKQLTVDCMISHKDGHIEKSSLTLPFDDSGAKTVVQSIGSSMSYAKRYALCLKLNIATGGEDNDGNTTPQNTPNRSLDELIKLFDNVANRDELKALWDSLSSAERKTATDLKDVKKSELP